MKNELKVFIIFSAFFMLFQVISEFIHLIVGTVVVVIVLKILAYLSFSIVLFILYKMLKVIHIDDLTGVYNRKHFFFQLKKEMERARRLGLDLSLCMFDLDDFKKVNDNHGHYTGDIVLSQFSSIVSDSIRKYDIFARLGGEEFGLIIVGEEDKEHCQLCERIRKTVEEYSFQEGIKLTVSIGVTKIKSDSDIDSLYKEADDAMFESKEKGKNRITIYK